jgi:dCTP deaminase
MMSTLCDKDIVEFCSNGILISEGFEKKNVKQACYELRASNIYYETYEDSLKCVNRNIIEDCNYILIKPKQCVVVITEEVLNIPNNVLCRILTKGKLLSIGLSAVNTYADPGFKGKLGIIFINHSNSYLKIKRYEPIAKIEFDELAKDVEYPYNGQHGYETGIWPLPVEMRLSSKEIQNDPRITNNFDEFELIHGKLLASYMRRIFKYERRLLTFSFSAWIFIFTLWLFVDMTNLEHSFIDKGVYFVLGILSSIIAYLIINFATREKNK